MKFFSLLLFLFLIAFSFLPAFAQNDPDEKCQSYPNVPVTISPRFDEPVLDFHIGIGQIQTLANDPTHNVHSGHKGLTLGLTRYNPFLEFRIPIKSLNFPDGLTCAYVENLEVSVGYQDVTVFIPQEIPQGTCGFDQVMAHEQKHITVNRQILDEYTPRMKEKLEAYLRINGVFREQNPDYALSLLKGHLQTILDEIGQEMMAENSRRQQLVDSPEEYRRISASCNGQLANTAMKFYKNNSGR